MFTAGVPPKMRILIISKVYKHYEDIEANLEEDAEAGDDDDGEDNDDENEEEEEWDDDDDDDTATTGDLGDDDDGRPRRERGVEGR